MGSVTETHGTSGRTGTVTRKLAIRLRRAREVLKLEARPGLRRELLTMDYLLPLIRVVSRPDTLRLRARSDDASGYLHFGRRSFPIDRVAYLGIFLEGWYQADYRDAVVVDVGAHKGYYAAYALLEGAADVRSFEPEAENFELLERSAATFDKPWHARRSAVASAPGTAVLRVSAESASHSLVKEEAGGPRMTLRSETVAVVGLEEVLAEVRRPGSRLIVKIDAEGSECDIVLGTAVSVWQQVDQVFLEVHDFAPCSTAAIVDHLAQAGLGVERHELDVGAELIRLVR